MTIAEVEDRIQKLQSRLFGAASAWSQYEADLRLLRAAHEGGLSANIYVAGVRQAHLSLQAAFTDRT